MNEGRSTNIRKDRYGVAGLFFQRKCCGKFIKMYRKTSLLESLFTKSANGRLETLLKRNSDTSVFLCICKILMEHLLAIASVKTGYR